MTLEICEIPHEESRRPNLTSTLGILEERVEEKLKHCLEKWDKKEFSLSSKDYCNRSSCFHYRPSTTKCVTLHLFHFYPYKIFVKLRIYAKKCPNIKCRVSECRKKKVSAEITEVSTHVESVVGTKLHVLHSVL